FFVNVLHWAPLKTLKSHSKLHSMSMSAEHDINFRTSKNLSAPMRRIMRKQQLYRHIFTPLKCFIQIAILGKTKSCSPVLNPDNSNLFIIYFDLSILIKKQIPAHFMMALL